MVISVRDNPRWEENAYSCAEAVITEGGTPEEWSRLITSLVRLGNTDHAREILAEAKTRFASQTEALATVTAAADSVGLK